MTALGRYYDWLSRFQRIARWVSRSGDQTLTVHRRLSSDHPDIASHDVVHERLLAGVGPLANPRVIDAGCGLGGTTFYLHARLGGRYHGLTLSPSQRDRAERAARQRGVSAACRFHVRSYDDSLDDLAPGGADLIVAIESLAHSPAPARTIASLARALRPGGRLAVIDDVPGDELADSDPDFLGFRSGWSCSAIARRATLTGAMTGAGLEIERDEDLTPIVILRDPGRLEQLVRLNQPLRRLLGATPASTLVESLHGGLMLERLYQRGLMQYRLLVGRRRTSDREIPDRSRVL